jgi:hypothetical protein
LDRLLTLEEQDARRHRILQRIDEGLEAETVRGPQSVPVPDHMARMRAAEIGVEVYGLASPKRETKGDASTVINLQVAGFISHPSDTLPASGVIDIRVTKEEEAEPA